MLNVRDLKLLCVVLAIELFVYLSKVDRGNIERDFDEMRYIFLSIYMDPKYII